METHVFASLAHVQILLLPVGGITNTIFQSYAEEIRSFDTIRLGDIPENKDERARFMPNALSTGHLHLSYPSHPPPNGLYPLSLLRPSRFPLGVIGIASSKHGEPLAPILSQFTASLIECFPADALYPLARNCFVFEEGDGAVSDNISGVVVIPSIMGNKRLYIGTLLADMCSQILGEFAIIYQALESPLGNEFLNASSMPIIPLSSIPNSVDNDTRRDSLPPLPSHNSQPEMSRPSGTHASLKRNSSAGIPQRHTSLNIPPASKKRLSGIGAASPHGRLFKVLADFFLLAGRIEDAAIWYGEAIQLFKGSHDAIWHASALEGLAVISILEAWTSGHGLNTSTSAGPVPWTSIVDKLTQAAALYFKSPLSEGSDQNYSLLAYLYCSCIIRHTSLLFAVWSSKGWGPLAFTAMLQSGTYLPPTLLNTQHSWTDLERLSSISGISRSSISTVLAQVHGPWLLHLGAGERIAILEMTANLYGSLGFKRKAAYILREVLGCILDLLVCSREEDSYSNTARTPAGDTLVVNRSQMGVRVRENPEGNESILALLEYVCKVLGIDIGAVTVGQSETSLTTQLTQGDPYAEDIAQAAQETCGWPELQIGVIREAVAIAEALPDYLAVAQFALSALKTLQAVLAPGDQYHLHHTAAKAISTVRRRGDTPFVPHWSGRPIVSISLAPIPLIRLPNEKSVSILKSKSPDSVAASILTGDNDPFLYNPRRAFNQGQPLVVQNEILDFVVMLQNPYVFDLEIQSINLSTSGVAFESQPLQVTIPPTTYHHQITLSGRATETGVLTIRGCFVQVTGASSREFILPLSTEEEEERVSRKKAALDCETGRYKYSGLDCFPVTRRSLSSASVASKALKFLTCKVVPEQPMLRIRRTSVTHGALMLYDGEVSKIRLTLENVSALPVDFVRLVFDDSTIAPTRQALSEGQLSVFETYEAEYDLIHRPMFTWDSEEVRTIEAGEQLALSVTCRGKVDCTHGIIHVSYASVRRSDGDTEETFYTRQISYPLIITVYHMLECRGMDIVALSYPELLSNNQSFPINTNYWCLFSVDIRNAYGIPFEICVERKQEGVPPLTTTTVVSPGSTCRVVVPLKKFLLPESHVAQPIPTLSDRQFVVNQSKLSSEEEVSQRELFWYREALLECIQCRWREAAGNRFGELSLRQQRMTWPMLEALRCDAAELVPVKSGIFFPPGHQFIRVRTSVTNLTNHSLLFTVDLVFDPSAYIVYEGVLSDRPVGRLAPGEIKDVDVSVAFLALGRFKGTATVRAFSNAHSDYGGGVAQMSIIVDR